MTLATSRASTVLLASGLLHACGGGGGGGDGSGSNGRITAAPSTVEIAASPGDYQPTGSTRITIRNRPSGTLHGGANYSTNGIASLDFNTDGNSSGILTIVFKAPHTVPDGTYSDTIDFHICSDQACNNDIQGSPVTIRTSYEVSGGVVATISDQSISMWAGSVEDTSRDRNIGLVLDRAPTTGFVVLPEFTTNALAAVTQNLSTDVDTSVNFQFRPGSEFRPGTYTDMVTLNVCYDASCIQQLEGAPFLIPAELIVDVGAEPGFTPLEVESRVTLSHNVVDAEFSKSLNAIVMVATYPNNALYVYDVETATEVQQALEAAPTAVSVSPNGLSAAVGHDGSISVVELEMIGNFGVPLPETFDIDFKVFDLVLDGSRRVHAFPGDEQWVAISTIDLASGVETLSTGQDVYSNSPGRLHPSGNALYSLNIPATDSIDKWDITGDHASWRYGSPLGSNPLMCNNFWFKEDGAQIYTACGHVFTASSVPAEDLLQQGTLELTDPPWDFRIRSVSEAGAHEQIALIEYDWYHCERAPDTGQCFTHLALYDSANLSRQAVYSIPVIHVVDADYEQHGLFVFHDAVGPQKYLVSRLRNMPDQNAEYYLSVVP